MYVECDITFHYSFYRHLFPPHCSVASEREFSLLLSTEAQRYKNSPRFGVGSAVDIKWFRGMILGSAVCSKILRGRIFGSAVEYLAPR